MSMVAWQTRHDTMGILLPFSTESFDTSFV
jgi:hypothetical protein